MTDLDYEKADKKAAERQTESRDNCPHTRIRRVGRRRDGTALVDEKCPDCDTTLEQDLLDATVDTGRGVATDGGEPSTARQSSSELRSDGGEVSPPELPETVSEATEIEEVHSIVFEDGSVYSLSGADVLAVYVKHGREAFYEWEGAVIDRVEEYHEAGRYPARYGTQAVEPGESMADIASDAIYYGELRTTLMQIALVAVADDGEDPVEVVGLTADGTRDYDVEAALGGGADA